MIKLLRKLQFHMSHFQTKLLLAFLFCTLIPLTVIGFVSYGVSYRIAEDKIISTTVYTDEQLSLQINNRLKQAEAAADSIQYDMYTLSRSSDRDISEHLKTLGDVRNNISLFKTTFDFLHIFVFLPSDQMGSDEQLYFYPLENFASSFHIPSDILEHSGASSVWFYLSNVNIPFVLSQSKENVSGIACFRMLKNQSSNEVEYAYMILIPNKEFTDLLTAAFDNSSITSYIMTDTGQVVSHNGTLSSNKIISEKRLSGMVQEKDMRYHTVLLRNNWLLVTEIPESYIRQNIIILLNTILITLLFSLPIILFVAVMISRNLTGRIRTLASAMEHIQLGGNTSVTNLISISLPKNPAQLDEIDRLGITFEKMQSSLQEKMLAILDLSLSEEKLRYQLLQSQINPHFLYNILGSIQSCQSIGRLDAASQMIDDLTKFYRLTLRKSKELILIRDELEIARLYLEMEKLCHNDNLSWQFHIEDGVENYLICKFTLQPFLENCIVHGISKNTTQIHIDLEICYKDDTVLIRISDNGVGMLPRELAHLRNTLEKQIVNYDKHFGIGNVNKRISSPSFGNGTIQVDSHLYEGTTITLEFAQLEDEDEKSDDC